MRRAIAALLVMAATGCATHPAAAPAGRAPGLRAGAEGGTLTLSVVPASYALQALVRRWLASDIYEYAVTLQYWNGTSFADFDPPLTVVLPQKVATPPQQAVFSNLKQGSRYRAVLVIKGNEGGTAPTYVLNANTTSAPEFDFSAGQDVEDALSATVQGQLDPMPFSGAAVITAENPPAGTTDIEATLKDGTSGATLSTITYPVTQRAKFSNLKTGTSYQVALTAKQDGTSLQTATSTTFSWDPGATSLESDQTVTVTF